MSRTPHWVLRGGPSISEPRASGRKRNSTRSALRLASVHSALTSSPRGHRPQYAPIWSCVISSVTKGTDASPLHSGRAVCRHAGGLRTAEPLGEHRLLSEHPPMLYEFNFALWSALIMWIGLFNWAGNRREEACTTYCTPGELRVQL